MKRIISIFMALTLTLLSLVTYSSALTNEVTIEEMINRLKETGMTELTIGILSDEDIENLYNALISGEISISAEHKSAYMDPVKNEASTFGLINENNFDIEVAPIVVYSDDRIEYVAVVVGWQWDGAHPAARWEDAIRVGWDSSKFSYSGNYEKADYYYTHLGTKKVMGTDSSPAEIDKESVAFYTDLYNLFGVDRGGYCTFKLKPSTDLYKGTKYATSITATYYHNASVVPLTNAISIELVGGLISISFSNLLTDTLSDFAEIDYK